jgi:RNA polymerase sigma-70 factor (ECF subfamily)
MDQRRARFEAEVLPHLDAAYRFARWLSYSPADAEDVVQEAMLRAYRSFDSLRGSDVKTWLLVIVKNCHFTAAKQRQRRGAVPLPEENDAEYGNAMISQLPEPENVAMLRDESHTWDRLTATLPDEQRTVLLLREIEELDYAQIAAITNVPIGTVMSRLARSRAALKARWLEECEAGSHAVR